MTGSERNSEFCFPRISTSRFEGPVRLSDLLYSKTKFKAIFEKHAEIPATSGHLQLHALITCNSVQHFAGNSELFPV